MPAGCLNTRETHPGCKLKQRYGRGGVSAVCLVSCFLVCQVLDKGVCWGAGFFDCWFLVVFFGVVIFIFFNSNK